MQMYCFFFNCANNYASFFLFIFVCACTIQNKGTHQCGESLCYKFFNVLLLLYGYLFDAFLVASSLE